MKSLYMLLCVAAMTGCASKPFANRLSVSLDGGEVYVNSMYGPIGLTSKVDARDAEVVREMQRLKAVVDALKRQQPE